MIEFYFDCSSPWTYLAFHNIQPLARELDVPIAWRPILVGGIFNTINPSVYAARDQPIPAKSAYMKKDLRDWARLSNLEIHFPQEVFPVNSVKAMRACIALEPEGKLVAFATAVFEAYWGRKEDISQDAVLREICASLAMDADRLFEAIADPAIKQQLRVNTDDVVRRGGFGSPTIFIGDDMYFGNDRMPVIRAAIERMRRR